MRTHDFQIPLNAPDPVPVFSDETTEDLQRDGLRLIQKQSGFRYGEDAVLLAHYAAEHWLRRRRRPPAFVELGSQCGVVSILFAALVPGASGLGLELIDRQVDVMRRNIELNRLTDRLRTVQGDIRALACPGVALPDCQFVGLQPVQFRLLERVSICCARIAPSGESACSPCVRPRILPG